VHIDILFIMGFFIGLKTISAPPPPPLAKNNIFRPDTVHLNLP
jgi:hypothetical protein